MLGSPGYDCLLCFNSSLYEVANDNYSAKGTGKLGAWMLYNASVTYNPTKNLGLSFLVNNVFNKMPPKDRTYNGLTGTPYNIFDYNVFGRAMYIEANYKFGEE